MNTNVEEKLEFSHEINVTENPISIYQMGKVGSKSIVAALRGLNLPNSIHHIHLLSPNMIKESVRDKEKHKRYSRQLEHSKALRKYLDSQANPQLTVITAVRDPVAQLVSSLFQNIPKQFPHFIDKLGSWNTQAIGEFLYREIESYDINNEWSCNWFDLDFFPALGIDVYSKPFAHDAGFVTIEQKSIRVLVLRLENSETWPNAISGFLGLDRPPPIEQKNTGFTKEYSKPYLATKNSLKFSFESLNRVYSSKYCRHFYSESMIQGFTKKWTGGDSFWYRVRRFGTRGMIGSWNNYFTSKN